MPYEIRKVGKASKPYCVYNIKKNKKKSCFKTKKEAIAYMKALYRAEGKKQEEFIIKITPDYLKQISNLELRQAHQRVHFIYNNAEKKSPLLINIHIEVIEAMEYRKIEHYIVSQLDRETDVLKKEEKEKEQLEEFQKVRKQGVFKTLLLNVIKEKEKVLLVNYESELYDFLHKSNYNIYSTTLNKEYASPKVVIVENNKNTLFKDNNFDIVIGHKIINNKLEDKEILQELIRITDDRILLLIDLDINNFETKEILKLWIDEIVNKPFTCSFIGENLAVIFVYKKVINQNKQLIENMKNLVMIPDYISVIGNALYGDTEEIIILIKQDSPNKILEDKIANMFPLNIKKRLQFIYDSQGAQEDYLPLAQLAITRKSDYKIIPKRKSELKISKWFKPLIASDKIEKLDFHNIENLWDNWAKNRIDRGIAVEPKYSGFRVQLHKSHTMTRLYVEDKQQNILFRMPNIKKEVLFAHENSFILDGILFGMKTPDVPMTKKELSQFLNQDKFDDTKIKIYFFDCLNYNGENIYNKQWKERTSYLSKVFTKNYKYITKVGYIIVTSKSDLLDTIDKMKKVIYTDGVVLKTLDSLYKISGNTSDWAYFQEIHRINVKINKVNEIDKFYNYDVQILGKNGKLINCGKIENSSIKVDKGKIVEVAIFKIKKEQNKYFIEKGIIQEITNQNNPDSYLLIDNIVEATKHKTVADGDYFMYKMTCYQNTITMESNMSGRYIIHSHQKGGRIHCILRMYVLKPERREYLEGLTLDITDDKLLNIDYDKRIFCQVKTKRPIEWMHIQGNYPDSTLKATQYQSGIFRIINKGSFLCGIQKKNFKEFWLETTNKNIEGRWILKFDENLKKWMLYKTKRKSMDTALNKK